MVNINYIFQIFQESRINVYLWIFCSLLISNWCASLPNENANSQYLNNIYNPTGLNIPAYHPISDYGDPKNYIMAFHNNYFNPFMNIAPQIDYNKNTEAHHDTKENSSKKVFTQPSQNGNGAGVHKKGSTGDFGGGNYGGDGWSSNWSGGWRGDWSNGYNYHYNNDGMNSNRYSNFGAEGGVSGSIGGKIKNIWESVSSVNSKSKNLDKNGNGEIKEITHFKKMRNNPLRN